LPLFVWQKVKLKDRVTSQVKALKPNRCTWWMIFIWLVF